ncbi:MAG: hypothetical protein L0210_14650 [Rhodospirillales bacterium]|nr:hypothetical protein [Rhodospirillales bacterium]
MVSPEGPWVPVASLTHWGLIELRSLLHLVGILLGGHPRIPAGVWMVSSPVLHLNETHTLAVTASSARLYELRQKFEGSRWPEEAIETIGGAMAKWGVIGEAPTAPVPWSTLAHKIERHRLDGTIDPSLDVTHPGNPDARRMGDATVNGSRPTASLTNWAAVELGGEIHLVGILRGGHPRLRPNRWMITSPVRFLDPEAGRAITASSGRPYKLDSPIHDGVLPDGAIAIVDRAMALWGISGPAPMEPLLGSALRAEIAKRGLNNAARQEDPAVIAPRPRRRS